MKNTIHTRPIHQRIVEPTMSQNIVWFTLGSERYARINIRKFYKSARRLMNLSPFQARTYTFGRIVESQIMTVRKVWEIEAHFDPTSK